MRGQRSCKIDLPIVFVTYKLEGFRDRGRNLWLRTSGRGNLYLFMTPLGIRRTEHMVVMDANKWKG
jgi:hypothetical protein